MIQSLKNIIALFKTLRLTPFKQELVDCTLYSQRLNFLQKCHFTGFWSKMAQKWISEETLWTDCEENNVPIFALKMSKEA